MLQLSYKKKQIYKYDERKNKSQEFDVVFAPYYYAHSYFKGTEDFESTQITNSDPQ